MEARESKINYWKDLWRSLFSNFTKNSFGLTLYNPHVLIDDVISEIEENSFKNIENRKYFYAKLSYYVSNDEVIKEKLISQFKILRSIFNSDRHNYILETCKEIKRQFEDGLYFDESLQLIQNIICSESEMNSGFIKKINYYTQGIIVELIKKSFSIEDIQGFLERIFSSYSRYGDTVVTDFPHPFNIKSYVEDKNLTQINIDLVNYMHALTLEERINKLKYFYYLNPQAAYYIFVVKGIKGNVCIELGDVTFYSIEKKKFSIDDHSLHFENLQRGNKHKFIQVAVKVDYLYSKSSLTKALRKLDTALDILNCYFYFEVEPEISKRYTVIGDDGKMLTSSLSREKDDDFVKYNDAFDFIGYQKSINRLVVQNVFNIASKYDKSATKLLSALHWYRKGIHANREEDKMLNFWIALENLFNSDIDIKYDVLNDTKKNKLHFIQEIVASIEIQYYLYEYGWELYHYYAVSVLNPTDHRRTIPDEIVKKAQLDAEEGEQIFLENFIDTLTEIRPYEDNPFIIEQIDDVIKFYSKHSTTKHKLEEHIELVKSEILLIYRFRNLIVHNAHYDNALLPYWVWKLRSYTGGLIRRLINEFDNEKKLSSMLLKAFYSKEKLLVDLELGKINMFKKVDL